MREIKFRVAIDVLEREIFDIKNTLNEAPICSPEFVCYSNKQVELLGEAIEILKKEK